MAGIKDFSCVGGLEKHIRIVKEMVLFPLIYGDIYAKFNLRPPRGLLFYGPPGTGKTLVASALAVECSNSERKVSFISRKGSDCLSKWVGESEKKLQKIFQMAQQSRPCIIFFDEVDGLAPIRSSRQDFVHASVVSTLLALMDGLDNNSEIIVIGATNRLDAIDPALRRPGRFDRELYFPLPCFAARKDILSIHVKNWKQKPPQKFLAYLASKTVGFCGSDLQALCTEAVMCCVRRNYPQIYTTKSKYHINERSLKVEKLDFIKAQQNIVPASHRIYIAPVKTLSAEIRPLLQDRLNHIMTNLYSICPTEMITSDDSNSRTTSRSMNCPRILLCGTDDCHTRHLGPAVLHTLEHLPCHILDVTTLFEETGRAAEESIIQKVKAARHTLPSLLYVPDILSWWELVDEAARVVFTSLIRGLDHSVQILVLTTAKCDRENLPLEISELFNEHQGEIHEIILPNTTERENYFYELFLKANAGADNVSNKSSNGEIAESLPIKKIKVESKIRTKRGAVSDNLKKSRSDTHIMKLSRTSSTTNLRHLNSATVTATTITTSMTTMVNNGSSKREYKSACGEGPSAKRQRLGASSGNSLKPSRSIERLSEIQIQNILHRVVWLTEGWSCYQLESLHASLEWILDSHDSEIYGLINDCLANFEHGSCSGYLKRELKLEPTKSLTGEQSSDSLGANLGQSSKKGILG